MQEIKATGRLEIYSLNKGIVRIEGEQYWLLVKNQAMKDMFQTLKKGDTVQYTKKYSPTDKKFEIVSATKLPVNQATVTERTPQGVVESLVRTKVETIINLTPASIMEATIKEVNTMMPLIQNYEISKSMNWAAIINTLYISKVDRKK